MLTNKKFSLGEDALKLSASKIITLAISFVTAMFLSRYTSLEEYGTYSQILLVTNLAISLLMIGLPNSINYFLARADTMEEKQEFLSLYYTLNTLLSVVVGFTLVCATPLIAKYFDNGMTRNFMYFLAVYPWAIITASSIENIFIVYKKTSMLIIYRVLNSISLLMVILVVLVCNLTFDVYMLLFLIIQSIFAGSVYIIVKVLSKKIYISLDGASIKKILAFSIPIGLASTVGTLNIELDKLIVGNFLGIEQLAIYTNASKEMPVTIIAASLTAVLMPRLVKLLAQNKNKEAIELWGSAITLSYTFICFFATGLFVFAPDVMTLLYSEKYLSGVSVFRIFSIVLILRCTYFGIILNSKGNTLFILYSSLGTLGINIILNYIFLSLFGFIGPALATLISFCLMAAFQLIVTSKTVNIALKNIFPWKEIWEITLINIVFGIVFLVLKSIIPLETVVGEIIESIIMGCIWCSVYFGALFKIIINKWEKLKGGNFD